MGAGLPANAAVKLLQHSRVNPLPQGHMLPAESGAKKNRGSGALPSGAQLQREGRLARDEVLARQSFLR
ncbi:protein of unknown function [Pseudomonas sp. JV551A1]|nr:protein of unknown function [Pseudomonas sp. JV551A1]